MKLLIASACAVVAALQIQLSRARIDAYTASRALADARAVEVNGAPRVDLPALRRAAAGLNAALSMYRDDMTQIDDGFAWVLRQFPAANDGHFDPRDAA